MLPRSTVVLAALIAVVATTHGAVIKADCNIAVNGALPDPQPLVLQPGGSNDGFGFHLPTSSNGLINIPAGGQIRIVCAGSSNYINPLGSGTREATAVCVGGTDVTVNGKSYEFRELACNAYPVHTAKASGAKCYDGRSIFIDVGFETSSGFVKTMDICFDESKRNTLYSVYDLVSGIGGYQSGQSRPNFVPDNFYPGLNVDNLYNRNTQRETISKLLGSNALGDQYVHPTNDYFLARGHLTANADYVFGAQQRATFHFVNVAPQWQTFNGANWNLLEQNVRSFADRKNLNLKVYTGTHGVTTLPNVNNEETELWLYDDINGNHAIPVPKLFWKVVYNPKTEEGIVFLGVNNPYIPVDKLGSDYLICTSVCSRVSWLTWSPTDIKKGYSYCCDVNEFRNTVDTLPDFEVSGLLT